MASQISMVFKIISLVSWLTLLITGWMSLGIPDFEFPYVEGGEFPYDEREEELPYDEREEELLYDEREEELPYDERGYFKTAKMWTFWMYTFPSTNKYKPLEPLAIHFVLGYMICILILIFVTAVFFVLCFLFFVKKESGVEGGMLGNITRFHFVPILCTCALFIIGEASDEDDWPKGKQFFFSIFFGIIALATLIFIASQTNIESPSYAVWIIKYCAYGSLIALLIHHVGYVFAGYGIYEKEKDLEEKNKEDNKNYEDKLDSLIDWMKGCYIIFSILIGFASFCVSIFLKNIVIPFINLLIYIGMITSFYKLDKDYRKNYFTRAPGVFNIIIMIGSFLIIVLLGMKMRQN